MKALHEFGSVILISALLIGAAYAIVMKVKPDIVPDENVIEELIETVIEDQMELPTGTIDLTPNSPEEPIVVFGTMDYPAQGL